LLIRQILLRRARFGLYDSDWKSRKTRIWTEQTQQSRLVMLVRLMVKWTFFDLWDCWNSYRTLIKCIFILLTQVFIWLRKRITHYWFNISSVTHNRCHVSMGVCHSLILLSNFTVGFRRHSSEQCALYINVNYLF